VTASQTGKQHRREKAQNMDWSPWIFSTIRSLMLAVAPRFPRWLPSGAQPAPDTGLRGRWGQWALGCSSVLLKEIFLCS